MKIFEDSPYKFNLNYTFHTYFLSYNPDNQISGLATYFLSYNPDNQISGLAFRVWSTNILLKGEKLFFLKNIKMEFNHDPTLIGRVLIEPETKVKDFIYIWKILNPKNKLLYFLYPSTDPVKEKEFLEGVNSQEVESF